MKKWFMIICGLIFLATMVMTNLTNVWLFLSAYYEGGTWDTGMSSAEFAVLLLLINILLPFAAIGFLVGRTIFDRNILSPKHHKRKFPLNFREALMLMG